MSEQSRGTMVRERHEEADGYYYAPGPAPKERENSPLALAAFFTAAAAWLVIPAVGAVAGIILAIFAQQQIRRAGGRLKGANLATAAIVLGGVQIGFILFAVIGVMLDVPAS